MVLDIGVLLLLNQFSNLNHYVLNVLKLFLLANQWNHNLRNNVISALFLNLDCSFHDSPCLHLGNLRIGNSQTASAVAHHWVELMKFCTLGFNILNRHSHIISQCLDVIRIGRNKLMQRRIQVTNGHRSSLQSLVHGLEVALLEWNQLV